MPEVHGHPSVDPPDFAFGRTALRLLGLWRAEWRLVLVGLTCALCVTALSISIALVIRHALDDSIIPRHGNPLWPYIAAILCAAAVRFVLNFTRRFATARVGIRIEARMRELLYNAYLGYPRAFYDQHATGQVALPPHQRVSPARSVSRGGVCAGAPGP